MRLYHALCLLALGARGLVACASDEGAASACVARRTIFCRCEDGEAGWQTCLSDGSAYGACGPCDGSNKGPFDPSWQGDPFCGDGLAEGSEQCDDGNEDDADACTTSCRVARCGDGLVFEGVEACDDGNDDDSDGCTAACALAPVCAPMPIVLSADSDQRSLEGELSKASAGLVGGCGGLGREAVYSFVAPFDAKLAVTVSTASPTLDLVLYMREGRCGDTSAERCADETATGGAETLALRVAQGASYVIVVDSKVDDPGSYTLSLQLTRETACEGEGQGCKLDALGVCAEGTLVCDVATMSLHCVADHQPAINDVCGDGIDDDCDGVIDDGCPCVHDKCAAGEALGCQDPCVEALCAVDEFCCTQTWDALCVAEVATVCGLLSCAASCEHAPCQVGAPLVAGCDGEAADCVAVICQVDSFCCEGGWDELCVEKIEQVCSPARCE